MKCKNCGAPLISQNDKFSCEYCGSIFLKEEIEPKKIINEIIINSGQFPNRQRKSIIEIVNTKWVNLGLSISLGVFLVLFFLFLNSYRLTLSSILFALPVVTSMMLIVLNIRKWGAVVSLLLTIIITTSVFVFAFVGYNPIREYYSGIRYKDNIRYQVEKVNGERVILITGLRDKKVTEVIIPSKIGGITNIKIKEASFYKYTSLKRITLSNGVTSIGSSAFENCSSLTSVTMGNGVTSIGSSAFKNCSSLTSMVIPNNVKSIGYSAFENCSGLTSMVIPNNVTGIGHSAFENCIGLKRIMIGNGAIGYSAFENCSSLTSVTMGNGVTSIGDSAFKNCSSLTSVIIGNGVTKIYSCAFNNCTSLKKVTIGKCVESIDDSAFANCGGLETIIIPSSVTAVERSTFNYCSKLNAVYYSGTAEQWTTLIKKNNLTYSKLNEVTCYYYVGVKSNLPNDNGNYWRYVNGEPTPW